MKNKALLYGLTAGLAVLLYFKFGRKPKTGTKEPTRDNSNPDLSKELPKTETLNTNVDRRKGTTDDPEVWDSPVTETVVK